MSSSNVRNIESLESFHAALLRLGGEWDQALQEIRALAQRADEHFRHDQPAYWRRQIHLAERELNEARDSLAQKRAAARAEDRSPASETASRVNRAERRLRECQAKLRLAKAWSLEISRRCDQVLGPLSDVVDHCQIRLPAAAMELKTLIEQLRKYAQEGRRPD